MFIGGASGSTAGGVKVNTFATVALTAFSYVRGRHRVHAFGKTIPEVQVHRAVAIVFFTAALVFALALALSAIEGFDFTKLLFESVSAVSTTGYTAGVTPDLSLAGKGLIMFGMFAGRIGPLTLALALSARSVETREAPRHDEAIRVG
jgi:trk system potassium uptake protein TrkH